MVYKGTQKKDCWLTIELIIQLNLGTCFAHYSPQPTGWHCDLPDCPEPVSVFENCIMNCALITTETQIICHKNTYSSITLTFFTLMQNQNCTALYYVKEGKKFFNGCDCIDKPDRILIDSYNYGFPYAQK